MTANILNLSPESAERKIQLAGLLASLLFRRPSHPIRDSGNGDNAEKIYTDKQYAGLQLRG